MISPENKHKHVQFRYTKVRLEHPIEPSGLKVFSFKVQELAAPIGIKNIQMILEILNNPEHLVIFKYSNNLSAVTFNYLSHVDP